MFPIRCQEIRTTIRLHVKERGRETHRQRLSSRRRRKRFARFSSQRARDHSSSSSFCGVPKAHSQSRFLFFLLLQERESKVPSVPCVWSFSSSSSLSAPTKLLLPFLLHRDFCAFCGKKCDYWGRRQRWCYPKKKTTDETVSSRLSLSSLSFHSLFFGPTRK